MKQIILLPLCLLFLFVSSPTAADHSLIGLKVSTTGISLDAARSFTNMFNLRLGGSWLLIPAEVDTDDFVFKGNLNLLSLSLLGDYFPFRGMFRLTGGSYINLNKASIELTPTEAQTIGGITYSKSELGVVDGDVTFNLFSPYLGIGLGNAATKKGLTFLMDLGVIYHGEPKVDLSSGSLLKPTAEQAPVMENNLNWAQWYPVLSLGMAYRI